MRLSGQQHFLEPQSASWAGKGRTALVCLLLALITLGVFWPVIFSAFTEYDDADYVTGNAQVQQGLTWKGLVWAFASIHGEHTYWHPLTWVSHMADCEVFGVKAWGHHLVNLLLHTLNTVLVFLVFRRLTGAFWRCVVLAGLFGLHPLQVDTVAWVAERKNLLSALFWLLTMWAYGRYAEKVEVECRRQSAGGGRQSAEERVEKSGIQSRQLSSAGDYGLALAFFVCGLMSKPVLVTLPFVLLLLDYWPAKRFDLNTQRSTLKTLLPLLWEKLPFFALAAASSLVTIMAHQGLGMLAGASTPPLALRVENAVVSYVRYLGSTIWPVKLAVFYPYPNAWPMGKAIMSGMLLLGVSGLAIRTARNRPYLLVGWFWFLGVLLPFIGLVQVGLQALADRFAYVPVLGLLLALVWGAQGVAARWRYGPALLSAMAVAAAVFCTALTRRQIGYWKDGESLWKHALSVTRHNDVAQHNLACALASKQLFDEAIPCYEEAIQMNPGRADTHSGLAFALAKKQRFTEAIKEYEQTLRLNDGDAEAHNNLGSLLLKQERTQEAIEHYIEASRLNATNPEPRINLALAFVTLGRYPEAATQLREAIRLDPGDVSLRQKLDGVLAAQEKLERSAEPHRENRGPK